MMEGSQKVAGGGGELKSFISEAQIEEKRKKRQEEWEKVRNPEDPAEAPEEEYDPRTLFQKLQDEKDRKQQEFEEAHKLKNMVKGLEEDEVAFLDLVDRTKMSIEAKKNREEALELEEYKMAVSNLASAEEKKKIEAFRKSTVQSTSVQSGNKKSELFHIVKAVKRKSDTTSTSQGNEEKKIKTESEETLDESTEHSPSKIIPVEVKQPSAVVCVGVLPGVGVYTDSSDSENSSSDLEHFNSYDLLGRLKKSHGNCHEAH